MAKGLSSITDAIFPIGLLVLAYLVLKGQGLLRVTSTLATGECPRGAYYDRGIAKLWEACDPGYTGQFGFEGRCICQGQAGGKAQNQTSSNVQPIPLPVIAPSARSCEQAGYPPPCVRPDSGTTAATPYLEQPGMPFDPCIQNPLSWECITR